MEDKDLRLYGLIGHPLGHSLSATFFAQKFQREHIAARYSLYDLADIRQLPTLLSSEPRISGLNVTIPYKQSVIPLLTRLSPQAEAIGAVNVIKVGRAGELVGYNTDVVGFTRSLRPLLRTGHTSSPRALVLGSGGASRAVCYGLRQLGFAPQLVSRHPGGGNLCYEDISADLLSSYPLLVNCTPLGMYPHVEGCPPLPYESLTSHHLLFDLVYNPTETLFLRRGRERGAQTKNGLEMLHLQALAAWEIWNSVEV